MWWLGNWNFKMHTRLCMCSQEQEITAVGGAKVSVKWIGLLRGLGWLLLPMSVFQNQFEKFCVVTRYEVLPLETDWRVIIDVGEQ